MNEPATKSLRGKILRNTAWSTFAVIASPVLVLLFGGLTLRYLGLEQAGYALTVSAVLSLAGRFATFGIGGAALPSIAAAIAANDNIRIRKLTGLLLIVFALSSTATAIILWSVTPWFDSWAQCKLPQKVAENYILVCGLGHVLTQINLALTTMLRAANRYDLVTFATTPLAFATGAALCILLPVFPSLITVAALSATASLIGMGITAWLALKAIPQLGQPLPGFGELPALVRYGGWLLMSSAFTSLSSGVDDLVIVGVCGPAAVPPWAIGKRFWMTIHTFLAQHVEHLIPLLGSLRLAEANQMNRIAATMHWYVMSLAAAAFVAMAWSGEAVVGLVAGKDVAFECRVALLTFSWFGLGFALAIVPVTLALAKGVPRAAFEAAVILQLALFVPLCILAWSHGIAWLYYAPGFGVPLLPIATVATAARVGQSHPFRVWFKPVAVPLAIASIIIGLAGVPVGLPLATTIWLGALLSIAVLGGIILIEKCLGVNQDCHRQLSLVLAHGTQHIRLLSVWVCGAWERSVR